MALSEAEIKMLKDNRGELEQALHGLLGFLAKRERVLRKALKEDYSALIWHIEAIEKRMDLRGEP